MSDRYQDEVADLMSENARLKKALAFYADGRRYEGPNKNPLPDDEYAPEGLVYCYDVTRDHGKVARMALKGQVSSQRRTSMRCEEWQDEISPTQARRIDGRLSLRSRAQILHVRTGKDGGIELVTDIGQVTERSLKMPRDLEGPILDLVFF